MLHIFGVRDTLAGFYKVSKKSKTCPVDKLSGSVTAEPYLRCMKTVRVMRGLLYWFNKGSDVNPLFFFATLSP
jgi:hypothetical protein